MIRFNLQEIMIRCALCLYLLSQFCHSLPHHGNNLVAMWNKNTASGCFHNNTMFADTSIIPTAEPCLVCKCSKRNLVCVRRVCKDQPYPPPRGCVLVQKKSLCCPYLSCSKYHVNIYKNSQRDVTHEKTLEKNLRSDDATSEEPNGGGCIESGSLYASGSAMYRSSLCSYCYCINGQEKCIKPKCVLRNTKCKPIYMEASCCPIKYDCNYNSTALENTEKYQNQKNAIVERKHRSNVCHENGKYYEEGERLPTDDKRPCEVCYCIKGNRKCTIKKCAPVIRGCAPVMPTEGSCCPASYDCRRSIKFKRESPQEEEEEEDTDTIDFFSLLFGSDEPKEAETVKEVPTTSTTLPPFKSLPPQSTTEQSFFDFIRAGLEIIDANADKIDKELNNVVPSTTILSKLPEIATERNTPHVESSTKKQTNLPASTTLATTLAVSSLPSISKTSASLVKTLSTHQPSSTTATKAPKTTNPPITMTTSAKKTTRKTSKKPSTTTSIVPPPPPSSTTSAAKLNLSTTQRVQSTSTSMLKKLPTPSTTRKSFTEMSTTKRPVPTPVKYVTTTKLTPPERFTIKPTTIDVQNQRERLPVVFNADVLPDTKLIVSDESEADTLPKLEIIPFVAHDAIKTDKYESYHQASYDNLEKDYFAGEKEKPFRYNNKFIHHNYDESLDYVYTNPHDRIDNGPYYYETNENQFEAFSPPSEQDFLGGFSPKESIYDEVSTSANYELPLQHNDYTQKPLNTSTIQEHKSYLTSTERTVTFAINQTTQMVDVKQKQNNTIPDFKKISSNFTSFIDDLLQANALEEAETPTVTTTTFATTASPSTTTFKRTTEKIAPTKGPSTSAPIKSSINDDDFIIKHLKASTASPVKSSHGGLMEIFSKPTHPTMNGLLKLGGCNIYGEMYQVGQIIDELSNPCLECKCLPDIGVGCVNLRC